MMAGGDSCSDDAFLQTARTATSHSLFSQPSLLRAQLYFGITPVNKKMEGSGQLLGEGSSLGFERGVGQGEHAIWSTYQFGTLRVSSSDVFELLCMQSKKRAL